MIFLVQCPKCKNKMKYQSKTIILTSKRKNCVYCGKSFKIREQIIGKEYSR